MKVIIPATTANIGPGFDCLGIGLSLYNSIEVEEISEGLIIEVDGVDKDLIEMDENNLVYKSMLKYFETIDYKPKGLRIKQYNEIPIARGLGSSAASIVGGIVAANEMCKRSLSKEELLKMAVEIEGHPDNVVPALFGGLAISNKCKDEVHYIQTPISKDLKFVAAIPEIVLSTIESRAVLPDFVPFEDAVFNVGKSSLLVAALMKGELEKVTPALRDKLHQPYRTKLLDSLEKLFMQCKEHNIDNIFLSGAGSTVILLTSKKESHEENVFREIISQMEGKWQVRTLEGDNVGVRVSI